MTDFARIHTELLVQVASDRALEQVDRERDITQNDDTLTLFRGPERIVLAAGAVAAELALPFGASALRFIVVDGVEGSSGINIRLGSSGADPILVKPPTASDMQGMLLLTTSAASVYVDNPSATTEVRATILLGCSE